MPGFDITQQKSDALDSIIISDQEKKTRLKVLPSFGGNIAELTLSAGGERLTVIDGYRTLEAARANKGYLGAFLFPFPNRISGARYTFEGQEYQLPINRPKENNAIHGFFTHTSFELISQQADNNSAEFAITSNYEGNHSGYPFPCEITLCYRLESAGSFRSVVSVTNSGKSNMPLGIGWHPYFTLSSLGGPVDELQLRLPDSDLLLADLKNIPTGIKAANSMFQSLEPIGCSLFDSAFAMKEKEAGKTEAVTELLNENERWHLRLSQSTGQGGYNYLQVYIPPDRQTIALEPMTCPANSFNSGEGLLTLAPGQSNSCTFTISLHRMDS